MQLLDDWIVHATPSGYMDRDGWLKTIKNFCDNCNASEGNPQFLFFDGHDSHWDPDALELLHNNHVETFFLKAADSENDQPNDNGPNALLKGCYNEQKGLWDEKYPAEKFTPPYMN